MALIPVKNPPQELLDKLWAEEVKNRNCPDCGVSPGSSHRSGCDVARCLSCGGQRIGCSCKNKGNDVWEGVWPGKRECYEEGLVCQDDIDGSYHFDLNTWVMLDRPTSKAPPRRFFKTEIRVIVLSEEEWSPEGHGLGDIAYMIDEGPCVGYMQHIGTEERLPKQMANDLYEAGSEPAFFTLTDDGHSIDDIDDLAADIEDEQCMDEIVHDIKSREASEINNGGVEAQIEFLLQQGFRPLQIKEMFTKKENDDGGA